jgi:eukaryotic-like serine/threonine-protein kinase
MGVVYRAYDRVVKRDVALKTIKDIHSEAQLGLFYKECELLKSISHPNIIELFDIGVTEEEGPGKPYFVMPLLEGVTLQELIRTSSQRLTLSRIVDIITHTCRGLQAAHEAGLIHRDLKPSNIFVMVDDSVKLIDFGIARIADAKSETGWKGTLAYMSPEQIELKPVSPASDIFALGVVTYETLTRRRPFEGNTEQEIAAAILHSSPPHVSSLNPELNQAIASVIHKAIAKKPFHRFSTAREFAELLQKAMRNEPIEMFNPARIQPRIQRATRAFEEADYQFAAEILHELEAEGHADPAISLLRGRVDQVIRQKRVQRLIDTSRSRFEEGEHPLALQKLQEALELDPDNADAQALRHVIEAKRTDETIAEWFRLAREHLDNYSYLHARQAIDNVLALRPNDTQARKLASEIQHREQEYLKIRQEKEQLFRIARESWQKGEVSSALVKLEQVLELEHKAPDRSSPGQEKTYLTFYNEVRSEHDALNSAYAEGRRYLAERNFDKAKAICDNFLAKYAGNALFQALRFEIEEQERRESSSFIIETDRKVEADPDLDRRVAILEEALKRYPGEVHFERALRLMRERRDFVRSIVVKANAHESQGQYVEAIGQWEILRSIYGEYPGLEFEIDRISRRRDQQLHTQAKAHWVEQVDQNLQSGDYARALELTQAAQAEFPNDIEINHLEKLARQGIARTEEAQKLLAEAQTLCNQKLYDKGIEVLRQAYKMDERNPALIALLSNALAEQARGVMESDPRKAEELVQQALELDPNHTQARSLNVVIRDRKRNEYLAQSRARVRELQAAGDIKRALEIAKEVLAKIPDDPQFSQLYANLEKIRTEERQLDLERLQHLCEEAGAQTNSSALAALFRRASGIAQNYPEDKDVLILVDRVRRRFQAATAAGQEQPFSIPSQGSSEIPGARSAQPAKEPSVVRSAATWIKSLSRKIMSGASIIGGSLIESFARIRPLIGSAFPAMRKLTRRPAYWIPAVAVFVLLIAAFGVVRWLKKPEPLPAPAAPPPVVMSIETKPAGAMLRVDGREQGNSPIPLRLIPGSHQIEITFPGYQPKSIKLEVTSASSSSPLLYELTPNMPRFRVETIVENAEASLDGNPAVPLQLGKPLWQNLAQSGTHTLGISDKKNGDATVEFAAEPLAIPAVIKFRSSASWPLVILNSYLNSAAIYSSRYPLKVALLSGDMQSELKKDEIKGSDGVLFNSLGPGIYTLRFNEGADAQEVTLEIDGFPSVSIHQLAQQAVAYVLVYTRTEGRKPVNGVRILVDGKEWPQSTSDGKVRIPNLNLQEHSFQVLPVPEMERTSLDIQKIQLLKGKNEITFTYRDRKPTILKAATLQFLAGSEHIGAEVFVDGLKKNTVEREGLVSISVEPGAHTITLAKQDYKHQPISKQFNAGESLDLTAGEVTLKATFGTIIVTASPPGARISYRASEVQDWTTVSHAKGQSDKYEIQAPAGKYLVQATADGYDPEEREIVVHSAEPASIALNLKPLIISYDLRNWAESGKANRWIRQGEYQVLKGNRGEQFVTVPATPPTGTYKFSWLKKGGIISRLGISAKGKALRCAIVLNEKNYVYFAFDGKKLARYRVKDGNEIQKKEISSAEGSTESYLVAMTVAQDRIVIDIADRDGKKIFVHDHWFIADIDLTTGKFGFDVRGEEEVWLSGWNFQQRRQ